MSTNNDHGEMDACHRCGYQFTGLGDAVRHYYSGECDERQRRARQEASQ